MMRILLFKFLLLAVSSSLAQNVYELKVHRTNSEFKSNGQLVSWGLGPLGRLQAYLPIAIFENGQEIGRMKLKLTGKVQTGFKLLFGSNAVGSIRMSGLNENTRISDLNGEFTGTSNGGSWMIPGPCCLTGGSKVVNLKSTTKNIELEIESKKQGSGMETDRTGLTFDLSISESTFDPTLTLGEVAQAVRSMNVDTNHKAKLECTSETARQIFEFNVSSDHLLYATYNDLTKSSFSIGKLKGGTFQYNFPNLDTMILRSNRDELKKNELRLAYGKEKNLIGQYITIDQNGAEASEDMNCTVTTSTSLQQAIAAVSALSKIRTVKKEK